MPILNKGEIGKIIDRLITQYDVPELKDTFTEDRYQNVKSRLLLMVKETYGNQSGTVSKSLEHKFGNDK